MTIFLIVYGIIAIICYCIFTAVQINYVEQLNKDFKIPVYTVKHFKLLIAAAFFPITLLTGAIAVIIDEKGKK